MIIYQAENGGEKVISELMDAYAISTSEKGNVFIVVDKTANEIQQITDEKEFIQSVDSKNLERVVHLSLSTDFTVLPKALFEETQIHNLASFAFSNANDLALAHSASMDKEIIVIWGEKKERLQFNVIRDKFPNLERQHIAIFAYNYLFSLGKSDALLALHFNNELLVGLLLNGKFQLINLFEASTVDEAMYYILMISQEYTLSQENIAFELLGSSDLLREKLTSYFGNISRKTDKKWSQTDFAGIIELL